MPPNKRLPTFTPELQLQTLFVLNEKGRIVSTREPKPSPGPRFALIRGATSCAWAIHADFPVQLAGELEELARQEPATEHFQNEPLHAKRYVSLVGGSVNAGPAFTFPEALPPPRPVDIVVVEHFAQLEQNFRGWTADELPGCSPILAVIEDGYPVSVCFCARRSDVAAEAGVETVERFRRRGLASRVTAAWALAIRSLGLLPIYSTSWSNAASLGVARRLALKACASNWSLCD